MFICVLSLCIFPESLHVHLLGYRLLSLVYTRPVQREIMIQYIITLTVFFAKPFVWAGDDLFNGPGAMSLQPPCP